MKNIIHTDTAPKALGPYSQAVKANGFLFLSGQIALDPVTGEVIGTTTPEQTIQVLKNLKAILISEGLTFANVVKANVYLKDMNDFAAMNAIYAESFVEMPPARACVEVSRLPKDVNVEIELIAVY